MNFSVSLICKRYSLPTYAKPVPSSIKKLVILASRASLSCVSLCLFVTPAKAKLYGSFVSSCAKSLEGSGMVALKFVIDFQLRSYRPVSIQLSSKALLHPFSTVWLTKNNAFSTSPFTLSTQFVSKLLGCVYQFPCVWCNKA